MEHVFEYPFTAKELFTQRKSLKRKFQANLEKSTEKLKIAVLGGSTTTDLIQVIELMFLNSGVAVEIFESEYNRFKEIALYDSEALSNFAPDVIYIHTTVKNLDFTHTPELVFAEYKEIWGAIRSKTKAPIIQNNFEFLAERAFGNLESSNHSGKLNFINSVNAFFSQHARETASFYLNDINYLSSFFGIKKWFDSPYWNNYKIPYSVEATPYVAKSFCSIVTAHLGKSKKCLVLDLDNTLWGGVIGDDGLNGISIGQGDALGEAYLDFQKYIKGLKLRGVILAVCSKNDIETAKAAFSHPDSFLKLDDFSSFQASWDMKTEGLKKIAQDLNIGLDSLVFIDDNPAERELIRKQLPMISVPEIGEDVSEYAAYIDMNGYFESVKILKEDLDKGNLYSTNQARQASEAQFDSYHEFLVSLEMSSEIRNFSNEHLDRITQLLNKTNQFNLTTKRVGFEEVKARSEDVTFINFYGRLKDKFGDNGLVSVISGAVVGHTAVIDLWVMSCRVFKRELEIAMFNEFLDSCLKKGIKEIKGIYIKSEKNKIVANLYEQLGFTKSSDSEWVLADLNNYKKINSAIKVEK